MRQSFCVSVFEVNDFIHPESDLLFSCGLPIKVNRWSLDLFTVNRSCPFECNLVKVPCCGHFRSPKNVGSSFPYFYSSENCTFTVYQGRVTCEVDNLFINIYAINLPPARRALGDHGDSDAQNCMDFSLSHIPLLRTSSYLYQGGPGLVTQGTVSKTILHPSSEHWLAMLLSEIWLQTDGVSMPWRREEPLYKFLPPSSPVEPFCSCSMTLQL